MLGDSSETDERAKRKARLAYRAYYKERADEVKARKRAKVEEARRFVADYLRDRFCESCGVGIGELLRTIHPEDTTGKRGNGNYVNMLICHGHPVETIQREIVRGVLICKDCHKVKKMNSKRDLDALRIRRLAEYKRLGYPFRLDTLSLFVGFDVGSDVLDRLWTSPHSEELLDLLKKAGLDVTPEEVWFAMWKTVPKTKPSP